MRCGERGGWSHCETIRVISAGSAVRHPGVAGVTCATRYGDPSAAVVGYCQPIEGSRQVRRITGQRRNYAWGSRTAIPQLLGSEPDHQPFAELWFGNHPSAPSQLVWEDPEGEALPGGQPPSTGSKRHTDLGELIDSAPAQTLGASVVARFGPELPYLLKLIAADQPLSLQVHPHIDQARAGFAAENAAGVPIDAPHRNYRDENHKPELVYALTTLEALSGFRAPRRAAELLADLAAPLAQQLAGMLRADLSPAGVKTAFTHLLAPETRPSQVEIDEVVAACAQRLAEGSPSPRADQTVVNLAKHFPGDPGAVTSLLLNPVTLQPGEAMFVPAGGVHAYQSGLAVEVMANSDNVLRAGLTEKHVDIPELLANVDYVAAPPIRIGPETFYGATRMFYAPVDDFEVSVTTLEPGDQGRHPLPGCGPRIVLCLAGEMTLASETTELTLTRGQAVFAGAADGPLTVSGAGTVVQADVP